MSHLEPCSSTAKSISNKWIGHGNSKRERERERKRKNKNHSSRALKTNQCFSFLLTHSHTHTLFFSLCLCPIFFFFFFLLKSESLSIAPRKASFSCVTLWLFLCLKALNSASLSYSLPFPCFSSLLSRESHPHHALFQPSLENY